EAIAYSYWRAYNVPLVLTNTMNLIAPGPGYQSSEKFVPLVVSKVANEEEVQIHSTPEGVSGSRCWIDVRDFADAWLFLTEKLTDASNPRYRPTMPEQPPRFTVAAPAASNPKARRTCADELGAAL